MIAEFIHPLTKATCVGDGQGNLHAGSVVIRSVDSCYDFAHLHDTTRDRAYYDERYHHCCRIPDPNLSSETLRRLWERDSSSTLLYHSAGDLCGKRVLLLGNGSSLKELRFVEDGAHVIYTDISLEAVLAVKRAYENSPMARQSRGRIEFHAVDALHLPFTDNAFDIIYGCALVHHIQDLDVFFSEVCRCLKTGGRCIFLDDAYSPIWQLAKKTILRPLQAISHWRTGISPEDRRATRKGGYRIEELQGILTRHGFRHLMYRRTMFLEYLMRRGLAKLLSKGLAAVFAPVGRFIDLRVLGPRWLKRHGLHLVWGYNK